MYKTKCPIMLEEVNSVAKFFETDIVDARYTWFTEDELVYCNNEDCKNCLNNIINSPIFKFLQENKRLCIYINSGYDRGYTANTKVL